MIRYETEVWRAVAAAISQRKEIVSVRFRNRTGKKRQCCTIGGHPRANNDFPYSHYISKNIGGDEHEWQKIMIANDDDSGSDSPAVAALKEAREIDFELSGIAG